MEVVKNSGVIVPVSGDQFKWERNISIRPLSYQADVKQELTTMMRQIAKNEMQLTIEKVYPFDKALEALQKTRTRHARGKVVIEVE